MTCLGASRWMTRTSARLIQGATAGPAPRRAAIRPFRTTRHAQQAKPFAAVAHARTRSAASMRTAATRRYAQPIRATTAEPARHRARTRSRLSARRMAAVARVARQATIRTACVGRGTIRATSMKTAARSFVDRVASAPGRKPRFLTHTTHGRGRPRVRTRPSFDLRSAASSCVASGHEASSVS